MEKEQTLKQYQRRRVPFDEAGIGGQFDALHTM